MSVTMPSPVKRLAARALDLLLPPLCLVCDEPVGAAATLCTGCWTRMQFVAAPLCACCGAPFDVPDAAGMVCGACLAEPPRYATARAVLLYDDFSRQLVLGFKHGDRTHGARALAAWMARAGGEMLAKADLIVPVPLHRWRLFSRRYNQSALLAMQLGRLTDKPVAPDLLRRIRATPSQGHRKRKERQDNVRGAFAVLGRKNMLTGKNIVLIDDVLTTGATVEECARQLLEAGAARVEVLTLARVKSKV